MRDALEYGKDDWNRSLDYLRDGLKTYPSHPTLLEAMKELRAIQLSIQR